MLRVVSIAATFCALGCPSRGSEPSHPSSGDDSALRVQVARAEVKRAAGVSELARLARDSDPRARVLALRGLGRIGGADALAVVREALSDRDPDSVAAAMAAIGVAASLDDDPGTTPDPARGDVLVAAIQTCGAPCKLAGVEALGRAGSTSHESVLVAELDDPPIAATAALALGRYGRRKLALTDEAEAALVHASSSADHELRYAAIYAISRMVVGDEHPPTTAALISVIGEPDPEIRATAIAGLARRKQAVAMHDAIEHDLADPDWRVAVEAVRALAGDSGDDAGRVLVANQLPAMFERATTRDGADTQVLVEALRVLFAHPPSEADAIATFAASLDADPRHAELAKLAPRSRGWIDVLARALVTPATAQLQLVGDDLPRAQQLGVAAELALHQDLEARRALLRVMLSIRDPRVKAATLPVLVSMWKDSDADEHRAIVAMFVYAFATPGLVMAGTAADSFDALYDAIGDAPDRAALDTAIVTRAQTERDPELAAALVEAIGKHAIASGLAACRAGLAGHPVLARASAGCMKALGESGDVPPIGTATAPPKIDVADVIGKRVIWHLATSRGVVSIELRPDIAPWNVATIVALTERHFYDGLDFHRVVPDFVVQGGDPTMSGDGGPGFTTPAEPASVLDGAGFVTGGIGMADAGRDSAGSQWFAMHSRAPHLDGRYTWVGQVVSGQNVVDSLLIGDRVDHATIELARK